MINIKSFLGDIGYMTKAKELPSLEYLNECFVYDERSGELRWKTRPEKHFNSVKGMKTFNSLRSGKIAGYVTNGYLIVNLNRMIRVHRIIWKIFYGEDPHEWIDHINGDTLDNRIKNLRNADCTENNCNRKRQYNNISGFKGVFLCKETGRYRSQIRIKGKVSSLGRFDTPELAHEAYCLAADRIHGEFASYGERNN